MVRRVLRIRFLRLLSPYVNAIILETASSLVCPDTCVRLFTPTVRTLSTSVYSPRPLCSTNAPTIATSPDESLRVARRLSITSFKLPRYTTILILKATTFCNPVEEVYQTSDAINGCINCNKSHNAHDSLNLIVLLSEDILTEFHGPSTAVRQEVHDRRVGDLELRELSCKPYPMGL